MTTTTAKELQQMTDKLIREQQILIDQNIMLKEDSAKYKNNVKRYEEISRQLDALDAAKAEAMSRIEQEPRVVGVNDKGGVITIGTPEAPKPLTPKATASIAKPHVNQPAVGESLPTPELPKFKHLDALEIKRQGLEIKREELLKQLESINAQLAEVKAEMTEEINKVREHERQQALESKAIAQEKKEQTLPQMQITLTHAEAAPKPLDKPIPKFPLLAAATNRKEMIEAVKHYRQPVNGKYFPNISLNKDTTTIVAQLNKSLEAMHAKERVTLNQLKPETKAGPKTTKTKQETTATEVSRKEMIAALKALATRPAEVKLGGKGSSTGNIIEWYNKYCR